MKVLGKNVQRKDALDKVTGTTKFAADFISTGSLHARLVISPYAHARITGYDLSEAWEISGVRAVVTGEDFPYMTGALLEDRPPLAVYKVRHYGEPVAVVVADSELAAKKGADRVKVTYDPLPVVNSPTEALKEGAPLVHEQLHSYKRRKVFPEDNTNIANRFCIRKGNMYSGWEASDVVVEERFSFSPSDHAALEPRSLSAEITPGGMVNVRSSSQAPYVIEKLLSKYFNLDPGKVIVHTPPVGGAFGGKSAIQLELIAYLASQSVGGRQVKLTNTREEDMISSPCHIGLDATIKLGAAKDGTLKAVEMTLLFDGGAYSGAGITINKAAAADCTGPYKIDNVWCDSLCMYTNHPYAMSFRGFGHSETTFPLERTLDVLAEKLQMDPLALRMKNTILAGETTPTGTQLTTSNIGNVTECLSRLKTLINWEEGRRIQVSQHKVRAKGLSLLWKTSSSPRDAASSAIVTFNKDGSLNLNIGAVELGQGSKTVLAQILAERMKTSLDHIYVTMEVNTQVNPEHWKTVASSTTFMVGRAVLAAAEDVIRQLKHIGAIVLRCQAEDLEVGWGRVYFKDNAALGIAIKEVCQGYKYPDGTAIGGHIIGRGTFIMRHLTDMDPKTGHGNIGPSWTVGAQAVEVELDTRDYTYRIVKAVSVMDPGTVINPGVASSVVKGAMSMGLSFASRESFLFDPSGVVLNPQLRTYKLMRFGEQPQYVVDFVETPQIDGPYGARPLGEHGLIGMPAALANSLSAAAGVHLTQLPLTPELIWKTKQSGGSR